jgi:hypothetical protein
MKALFFAAVLLAASTIAARAECIGSGSYQVCSDSSTDPDGSVHIRSYDTEGNSYSVDSNIDQLPDGGQEITSSDSEGNSYSVKSWSDDEGVHSEDSEGNECTIMNDGTVIGCGE